MQHAGAHCFCAPGLHANRCIMVPALKLGGYGVWATSSTRALMIEGMVTGLVVLALGLIAVFCMEMI